MSSVRRRNPSDDALEIIFEKWLPPGTYRAGRGKYNVDTTRLVWITSDGSYWVLRRNPAFGRYGDWSISKFKSMYSPDEDDDRGPYFTDGPALFDASADIENAEDADPREFGLAGYLMLQQMLPRFRELQRLEPKHRASPMPRKRRSW